VRHVALRFLAKLHGRPRFGFAAKPCLVPLIVGAVAVLVAACAAVDTVAPRGDTFNRTITDYRNEATLLNIIRASYNEPMNFVTLNTATGHGTLGLTAGLATYVFGPGTLAAPVAARNYSFGPNSVNASATDDFNIAVLDDPQSYGALMTPMDIAMMGFFFSRHWPMQLLLPIFVNYIRIIPPGQSKVYQFNTDDASEPFLFCRKNGPNDECLGRYYVKSDAGQERLLQCQAAPNEFICVPPVMFLFDYLTQGGLVVQVPVGAIPGTQPPPPARFCYESVYNQLGTYNLDRYLQGTYGLSQREYLSFGREGIHVARSAAVQKNVQCDSASGGWLMPVNFSQGAASAQPQNGAGTTPSVVCINGACAASSTQKQSGSPKKAPSFQPLYEFYDPHSGAIVQISTRSTWAIYQYLGDLVRLQKEGLRTAVLRRAFDDDREVFNVVENQLTACFAWVGYSGSTYCVPKDAPNSKMILSLLHELANLYTRSNNAQQPNTGTVRVTP
jgi:hypothetical protein